LDASPYMDLNISSQMDQKKCPATESAKNLALIPREGGAVLFRSL
jgi:hypothetical protein